MCMVVPSGPLYAQYNVQAFLKVCVTNLIKSCTEFKKKNSYVLLKRVLKSSAKYSTVVWFRLSISALLCYITILLFCAR
jgi:hypothetical protein